MNVVSLALLALSSFIVGALWRRIFGGWLQVPRAALLAFAVILFSLPAWWMWHDIDTGWRSVIVMLAIAGQFCFGAEFDNPWLCAFRYELGMLPLAFVTGQPWPLLVGPLVALVYDIGRISTLYGRPWHVAWPWDTATQEMTNGYTTFGEMAAGGLSVLAFMVMPLV